MVKITADYTTDELLAEISDLPVKLFGYREFEILQKTTSATVSDNYPDNMTVIELETDDNQHAELLWNDTKDYNFPGPHFIG